MKQLMTGNEAVARGAYEAGVVFASAYPGTPSTEIMENLTTFPEITAEWACNEKVALEAVVGASFAGARSMASMKHVGLNVAADPLFTFAYEGVNGGTVVVTADEPGQFSSQNEQDNRNYAAMAKIPMFEPANSQECHDMLIRAFDVSEQFNTPVLFRMTTRVCHSKSVLELGERREVGIKAYEKDAANRVCVPANAKKWRVAVEERTAALAAFSESAPENKVMEQPGCKTGVICSGICYHYAHEVFGDSVSYLKLGFTWPLPARMIKAFCQKLDTIYVLEENDPYIENMVRMLGFDCKGNNFFPAYGEMLPDTVRKCVDGETKPCVCAPADVIITREPTFCAGCPHRGLFFELGKRKDVMVSGDIGCYTLAYSNPYHAMDSALCMGASFSLGYGAQKVFNMDNSPNKGKRVVTVLGDSTFFHTGINSLMNTVYNGANTVNIILDNRITGMTGHQQNPGSGYNAKGEPAGLISVESVVRAIGVKHIKVIDPNDLALVRSTLNEFLALDEPSVIITRWPCVLKKLSAEDKSEFKDVFKKRCTVNADACIGCKACLKTGCPALTFDKKTKKAGIDASSCVGCTVCAQVCPKMAIG